jgi:hypothetical protein
VLTASAAFSATPPNHLWSEPFGGTGADTPSNIALDANGNIYVVGTFNGTTNLGGANLVSLGLDDGFIAKYNAAGVHQWSRRFGTTSYDGGASIVVDPSGNVIITGEAFGTLDIIVRKYDAAGTQLWTKQYGSATDWDSGSCVATDGAGNIFVTGYFKGSVNFGGSTFTSDETSDMFLLKLDPSGGHLWSKAFPCAAHNLATDATGAVTVVGSFIDPVDFGGGPLSSAGDSDAFVVRFDGSGAHVWSERWGGTSGDGAYDVACDPTGNVALCGMFSGTSDFGGDPLVSAGIFDVVVARYDSNGNHIWSHSFGGTDHDVAYGLALDATGNVYVTGAFKNTIDFGNGPLTSAGLGDVYITKYDVTGTHQWALRAGDANDDVGFAIAADNLGALFTTGYFQGSIDFGGGPLAGIGGNDMYLASFFDEPPIPVRISSFDARLDGHDVRLTWDLWSDEDLEGYTLYRSHGDASPVAIANGAAASTRSYIDRHADAGQTYRYELLLQTTSGTEVRSQPVSITVPRFSASLAQNSPNPFRAGTTIEYTLGARTRAVVGIYDAAGRLVARLDDGDHEAGTYRTQWNARDASGARVGSGVYFYRLEGARDVVARKMIVIR